MMSVSEGKKKLYWTELLMRQITHTFYITIFLSLLETSFSTDYKSLVCSFRDGMRSVKARAAGDNVSMKTFEV